MRPFYGNDKRVAKPAKPAGTDMTGRFFPTDCESGLTYIEVTGSARTAPHPGFSVNRKAA
jgi:hypothetical protein